jgi:hypothetical protein
MCLAKAHLDLLPSPRASDASPTEVLKSSQKAVIVTVALKKPNALMKVRTVPSRAVKSNPRLDRP